jgi:hypothetical protein
MNILENINVLIEGIVINPDPNRRESAFLQNRLVKVKKMNKIAKRVPVNSGLSKKSFNRSVGKLKKSIRRKR